VDNLRNLFNIASDCQKGFSTGISGVKDAQKEETNDYSPYAALRQIKKPDELLS
jgi:hypothetical protein